MDIEDLSEPIDRELDELIGELFAEVDAARTRYRRQLLQLYLNRCRETLEELTKFYDKRGYYTDETAVKYNGIRFKMKMYGTVTIPNEIRNVDEEKATAIVRRYINMFNRECEEIYKRLYSKSVSEKFTFPLDE